MILSSQYEMVYTFDVASCDIRCYKYTDEDPYENSRPLTLIYTPGTILEEISKKEQDVFWTTT